MMTPTRKDIAEFLRLGLRYQILSAEAVVAWADEVIAEDDEPPSWAIDLAFASRDDADDLLRHIPGKPQGDLSTRLLLGFVHLLWKEGRLSVEAARGIGWDLHCEDRLTAKAGKADWGVVLEVVCEDFDAGWRTSADVRRLIDESLAQYVAFEPLLPSRFR